jgi:ATP-dependent Clp protease ATP-binding subunit ClpA
MRNHFSTDVKETLSFSAEEAIRTNSPAIGAAHLLLGLIRQGHNKAVAILTQDMGLSMTVLADAIEATLPPGGQRTQDRSWRLPLDRAAERCIRGSVAEAKKTGSRVIGTEDLLYSLFGDRENQLYLVFSRLGILRMPGRPTGQ